MVLVRDPHWGRIAALLVLALGCGGDGPTVPQTPPGPVPVAVVQLDVASVSLHVGGTRAISAVAMDAAGTPLSGRSVTWSSQDPGVATVTAAGFVTAIEPGATLIAAAVEGKTASLSVTVSLVPVRQVTLTLSAASAYVGATVAASAIARDSAGGPLSGRAILWSSSNPAVITVASNGSVTAVAPGTAEVIAEIEGVQGRAPITVARVPVAIVAVSPSSAALYIGGTVGLSASARDSAGNILTGRGVAWSTSNATLAAVSSMGVVSALSSGTATITATVEGKSAAATVTVTVVPVASVSVSPAAAALYVGGSVNLSSSAKDSAGNALIGRAVAWTTSNSSVATVTSAGVVSAVAAGSATITATVEGKAGAASITVALVPAASVTVSPPSAVLYVNQTTDLSASARDSAGNALTGRAVAWSTSNSAVVTVSAIGTVTALAAGSATVSATVEGKTGTASITAAVVPVKTVSLSQGDATMYPTVELDYDASAADSAGKTLTGRPVSWSSSNAAVATVSSTGVVTAIGQGGAIITATVEGKTASATVTVRHDPIVFIHGFAGNASVWSNMTSRFAADGWRSADLVGWNYNSLQSNVTSAALLKTTIDSLLNATGAKRVDIITHSMGGLPSRYYLKNLDGAKMDAWVSLGGPNHGTDTANHCAGTYVSCAEMVIGSPFLTTLNSGDETPGTARYATWWSPCDTTINPDSTVALSGADNTETACLAHSALYGDATVYAQVRAWVR